MSDYLTWQIKSLCDQIIDNQVILEKKLTLICNHLGLLPEEPHKPEPILAKPFDSEAEFKKQQSQ